MPDKKESFWNPKKPEDQTTTQRAVAGGCGAVILLVLVLLAVKLFAAAQPAANDNEAASSNDAAASVLDVPRAVAVEVAGSPDLRSANYGAGASVSLPIAPEEKRLTEDSCDQDCMRAFVKDAEKRYPDIKRIRWEADEDALEADRDQDGMLHLEFTAALYFAKRIRLADGRTLFDLITKCSDKVDLATRAEFSLERDGKYHLSLQYFPRFTLPTGGVSDENVLLDRVNNTLVARSPWFSSHILTNPEFMRQHDLRCPRH